MTEDQINALAEEIADNCGGYVNQGGVDYIAKKLREAFATQEQVPVEVVAWRCKDYADGWILDQNERSAHEYGRKTGCIVQPLWNGIPSIQQMVEAISDEQLRHISDSKDTGTCRARIRSALVASTPPAPVSSETVDTYAKCTIENAYGMLWLTVTDDKRIHEARKRLLTLLDKDGQRRSIEVAKKMFGQTTEAEIMRADVLPDEKPDAPVENRPEWIWYCESTSGVPVVTFGRWPKHPQQARYKLAEIQPTEHDHPSLTPAQPLTASPNTKEQE